MKRIIYLAILCSLLALSCGRNVSSGSQMKDISDSDTVDHIPVGTKMYLKKTLDLKPNDSWVIVPTPSKMGWVELHFSSSSEYRTLSPDVEMTVTNVEKDKDVGKLFDDTKGKATVITLKTKNGFELELDCFPYNIGYFNAVIGDLRETFDIRISNPKPIE